MTEEERRPLLPWLWLRLFLFGTVFYGVYTFTSSLGVFLRMSFDGRLWPTRGIDMEFLHEDLRLHMLDYMLFITPIVCLSFVLTVLFFRKVFDRRSFFSLGFEVKGYKKDFIIGFVIGFCAIALGHVCLRLSGHLQVTAYDFDPIILLGYFCLFVLVAFYEELVFRGYILKNLLASYGPWPALLISSALFALVHYSNANSSVLGLINIMLAGLLFGVYYLHKQNLWFPIALHLTWNFFQGPVFGFQVSGLDMPSLVQTEIDGPIWLTGGAFGFEGSVLCTVLMLGLIYSVNRFFSHPDLKSPL
jgi:membrane protease YdiL (CAAX protease family)